MTNWPQILILLGVNGAIGFLIGAGTNALAIRWMFRLVIPRNKEKIARSLKNVVSDKIMPMQKIVEKIHESQAKDELRNLILNMIEGVLDHELDSMESLFSDHPEWIKNAEDMIRDMMIRRFKEQIDSSEFQEKVVQPFIRNELADGIQSKIPLTNDLNRVFDAIPEKLGGFFNTTKIRTKLVDVAADAVAARLCKTLRSKGFQEKMEQSLSEIIVDVKTRPIGRLDNMVTDDMKNELADVTTRYLLGALEERLGEFAGKAGVWDVIEESVIRYDDRQLEALVRKIADRELRFVTLAGGVIGLFIGLIQGLLFVLS